VGIAKHSYLWDPKENLHDLRRKGAVAITEYEGQILKRISFTGNMRYSKQLPDRRQRKVSTDTREGR